MKTKLTWKKGFLSTTCQIYSGDKKVGELKERSLSSKAYGYLNNKQYLFVTKGIFHRTTEIIDIKTEHAIGAITYNTWHTKAKISAFAEVYNWKYNNIWNTRWSLYEHGKLLIRSNRSPTEGSLEFGEIEESLVLSSLFVTNNYRHYTAVFAALIPLFIVLFI